MINQVSLLCTFACLALITSLSAQNKALLRLDLSEGQAFQVRFDTEQQIEQTVMGMEQSIRQGNVMEYTMKVEERRADGNYRMSLTYGDVSFEQDGPQGKVSYDSADPESEPDMQTLSWTAFPGYRLDLLMQPNGQTIEMQGFAELMDRMIDAYGITDSTKRQEFRDLLNTQFNADKMSQQLMGAGMTFPDKPVKTGDSWTQLDTITSTLTLILQTTYTVRKITPDSILIDIEGEATSDPNSAPQIVGEMELEYDLSGTQTGTIVLDRPSFWTRSTQMTQDFSGTATMLPNDQLSEGMSWPISIRSGILLDSEEVRE